MTAEDAEDTPARVTECPSRKLQRRIDLYRRYLREGVELEMAEWYLRELAGAEAALAAIRASKESAGKG